MSKIEVNQVDPSTGTTLTLGTSGDTITIPSGVTIANSGTATGFGGNNTPFFCAVKSSQTTGQSDNTWTKITFDTEVQDSDGTFASDKFTPAVAGKYYLELIASGGTSAASSITSIAIKIYKNGSEITGVNNTSKVENEMELFTVSTSAIITSDTDDYFEAYIKIDKSTNTNRVTTAQFLGYKLIE